MASEKGLNVADLLEAPGLTSTLRERLQAADANGDGIISASEMMDVMQREITATRDRKMMVRVLAALSVACVLIIAAVVGLTYAVVQMSKDTSVDNNVLVSKDGLQPLSTATLQQTLPLAELYKAESPSQVDWLTHVTVPFGEGEAVLKIQNAYLVPGERVRFDTAAKGVSVEVTAGGVTVTGDENNSTAARRRLMAGDGADGTAQGPRSTQGETIRGCKSSQDCGGGEYCELPAQGAGGIFTNGIFTSNRPSRTGKCKTKKLPGEACKWGVGLTGTDLNDDECVVGTDACGRATADDGAEPVCCPSGGVTRYGGYSYCTEMADGATCWSNSMCASKYCQGNLGGLQKGTCTSTTKANKETCTKDRECASDACGRLSADDAHTNLYLCCDEITTYAGVNYCARLPVGAMCWSNAMCLTGLCANNMGGLQRGLCAMG